MASIPDKALFSDYVKSEREKERMRLLHELAKAARKASSLDEFAAYLEDLNDKAHAAPLDDEHGAE